jgi:hypothetical protein
MSVDLYKKITNVDNLLVRLLKEYLGYSIRKTRVSRSGKMCSDQLPSVSRAITVTLLTLSAAIPAQFKPSASILLRSI